MADDPYKEAAAEMLHRSGVDDIKDKFSAQMVVQEVYEEITRQFGEDVAVKIFAPYGRDSKRHARRREDAAILLRFYYMDKRNVRQLALELAGPDGQRAMERRIWRLLRDPRVQAHREWLENIL